MKIKTNMLTFVILYILFCNYSFASVITSVSGLIPSPYSTINKENPVIITNSGEMNPKPLEGAVYDFYANGKIVDRGSSTNPLPRATSSTHPITKDEFQLLNLEEFAVLPIQSGINPKLYQDAGESFLGSHSFPEDVPFFIPPHGCVSDIAMADVDGDGYHEVIFADEGELGHILIYDDAVNNYTKIGDYEVGNPSGMFKSITTGDVDGDGCDEIIYTRYIQGSSMGSGKTACSIALWVFEFVPTWTCLTSYDFRVMNGYSDSASVLSESYMNEPEVACGDIDGDGRDEVACAYSFKNTEAYYEDIWILDDYNNNFTKIWSSWIFTQEVGDVDLVCGDFDGDGLDEVAYAACPWLVVPNKFFGQVAIIDHDFSSMLQPLVALSTGLYRFPVACGDIDGDGRDEIGAVMTYGYGSSEPGVLVLYEYLPAENDYIQKGPMMGKSYMDYGFAMGDLDCDGMAEMVFSGRFHNGVLDDANHTYAELLLSSTDYGGLVACGDVDGDGMRLHYTGESWQTTAPPGVIVVIAAPPLYAGIDQNYVSSYTAFGQETSSGTGESSELGTSVSTSFSVGQTISFEFIEAARFSWSRTVRKEFIRTNTITKTLTQTVSYATGWTDDAIIYHSTDYTSYKYQVISHPYNSSLIGSNMTINVPEPPHIIPWTLEFFNTFYNHLIGPDTFNHTIGQPWTYLTRSEALAIAPICWSSGEKLVGQGSGSITATIKVAEDTVSEMKTLEYSDYSYGGAIFGAGLDYTDSLFSSKAYEISVGEAAIYEGCVGFIADQETWSQLNYTYNMIVYYLDHPSGIIYQVINYYVEGAIPHYPSTTTSGLLNITATGMFGGIIWGVVVIASIILLVKRSKVKKGLNQ